MTTKPPATPVQRSLWVLLALLPGLLLALRSIEPERLETWLWAGLAAGVASALAAVVRILPAWQLAADGLPAGRAVDDPLLLDALAIAGVVALLAPAATPPALVAAAVALAGLGARQAFGGLGQAVFPPAMVALALLMVFVDPDPAAATRAAGDPLAAAAWLAGGGVLLVRRQLRWQAPLAMLVALAATSWLLAPGASAANAALAPLTASTTWLVAAFVVADPVGGASTPRARFAFGAGVGVLAVALGGAHAPMTAIAPAMLLMSLAAPALDRWSSAPRRRTA